MEDNYYHGLDSIVSKEFPLNDIVNARDSFSTWFSSPSTKEYYEQIVALVCAAIIMAVFIGYFFYCLCFRKRYSEGVVYESMRQPHIIVNVGQGTSPAC